MVDYIPLEIKGAAEAQWRKADKERNATAAEGLRLSTGRAATGFWAKSNLVYPESLPLCKVLEWEMWGAVQEDMMDGQNWGELVAALEDMLFQARVNRDSGWIPPNKSQA